MTAYLLRDVHQTTVFEASPILGGHIRTLNRNVLDVDLEPGVVAENGVLGFDLTAYPTFGRLATRLNMDLEPYVMHSGLFYGDGRFWVTPSPYQKMTDSFRQRIMNLLRLLPLWSRRKRLIASLDAVAPKDLYGRSTASVIPDLDDPCHQALLACFMLAFSMPFERVAEMPAELTVGYMQGGRLPNWYFLRGGVYSYIETILSRMPAGHQQMCNAPVESVTREESGVLVQARGQAVQAFDKVVFATDPGQVLRILADATEAEKRRFAAWSTNTFTTLAHRDVGIYRDYDTEVFGPCDYFRGREGDFGYNTYLNHGYGQSRAKPYSFAYNLDAALPTSSIIHRADHQTPNYTVSAFQYRHEVIETNGENHTFHAGAYLGNGLHEGAALSAHRISERLGGEVLSS